MRQLILISIMVVLLVLISGCDIQDQELIGASEICGDHKGLWSIGRRVGVGSVIATCRDGKSFDLFGVER